MKPLTVADIRGPRLYEGFRDDLRKHVIALKKNRRVTIGDRVTVVFENRQTLIFQIEEILRAEHITDPAGIQAEIDVYNPLMPSDDSLSATLFLEVPPDADPRVELDRLIGLDEHLSLHVGDHVLRAAFEAGRSTNERISAVQYVRFPLTAPAQAALRTPNTRLALEIDHPGYKHVAEMTEAMRQSLADDYR